MRLEKVRAIAGKDLAVLRRRPNLLVSLLLFPIVVGIGLPLILDITVSRHHTTFASLLPLTDAFGFFFLILVVVLTTTLAAYAIVGEKVERSLEPLLATPTTDGEILLGKTLGAFLPPLGATYLGLGLFMALVDAFSRASLGYYLYPDATIAVFAGLGAPLAGLFSVEINVIVSSWAADVRSAQQFGSLVILPFIALYVAGEIGLVTLDTNAVLVVAGVLAILDLVLFFVSRGLFRREEILTRWR